MAVSPRENNPSKCDYYFYLLCLTPLSRDRPSTMDLWSSWLFVVFSMRCQFYPSPFPRSSCSLEGHVSKLVWWCLTTVFAVGVLSIFIMFFQFHLLLVAVSSSTDHYCGRKKRESSTPMCNQCCGDQENDKDHHSPQSGNLHPLLPRNDTEGVTPPILHVKMCLQVLERTTAFMNKVV